MNFNKILRYIRGRQKSKSDGVTLIELIVVLVLIGIIAAFAIPNYYKSMERGKADEALANLKAIRSAQRIYRVDTLSWSNDIKTIQDANLLDVSIKKVDTSNICKSAITACTNSIDSYCYEAECPTGTCTDPGASNQRLAKAYRCRKGDNPCTYRIRVDGTIEQHAGTCPSIPANL